MGIFSLKKRSVKSVQRGSVSFNNLSIVNVSITDVVPEKCVIHVWGTGKVQNGSVFTSRTFQISLTSSTQVTITSNNFGFSDNTGSATWQVVEYY
jgi:hypothetical protein